MTADRCNRSKGASAASDQTLITGAMASHLPKEDNDDCRTETEVGSSRGMIGKGLSVTGGSCVEPVEVEGFAVGDSIKHRIISSRLRGDAYSFNHRCISSSRHGFKMNQFTHIKKLQYHQYVRKF